MLFFLQGEACLINHHTLAPLPVPLIAWDITMVHVIMYLLNPIAVRKCKAAGPPRFYSIWISVQCCLKRKKKKAI